MISKSDRWITDQQFFRENVLVTGKKCVTSLLRFFKASDLDNLLSFCSHGRKTKGKIRLSAKEDSEKSIKVRVQMPTEG